MTTPQNQKLPQPGEYWAYNTNPKCRRFIIGPNHQGNMVCVSERGEYEVFDEQGNMSVEFWHHLPDCDSFDWVPEVWPKFIINPTGFDDDTAYLRRDSKDVTVRVSKYGTERINYWDANRDGFVRSGAWLQVTEAEAKGRLTPTCPEFKLEVGKRYVTRDGKAVSDPVEKIENCNEKAFHKFEANLVFGPNDTISLFYGAHGEVYSFKRQDCHDLVAEYTEPTCPDCGEPVNEGHADVCPMAWVEIKCRDHVLRPGIDQIYRSIESCARPTGWEFFNVDPRALDGMESYFTRQRCRRKDLPPLPEPIVTEKKQIPLRAWSRRYITDPVCIDQICVSQSDMSSIGYIEVHGLNIFIEESS